MKKALLKSLLFITVSLLLAYIEIIPGMTREQIFRYYFLDYGGIFFVLIAQSLLKEKNKTAFVIYIIGLALNGFLGYLIGSYSIILFSVYSSYIFIDNWKQWKKDEQFQASQK